VKIDISIFIKLVLNLFCIFMYCYTYSQSKNIKGESLFGRPLEVAILNPNIFN
jgi:hypothetical protein